MTKFWLAKRKMKKFSTLKVDNLCSVSDFIFTTILFYVLMYCLRIHFLKLQSNDYYIIIHQYIVNRTK